MSWLLAVALWSLAATATEPVATPADERRLVLDDDGSEAWFRAHPRLPIRAEGVFGRFDGELLGADDRGWRVEVRMDGASLAMFGPDWMQRLVRSRAFLDLENHPEILFRSDPIAGAALHGGGEVRGRLTLRGQTRPVRFRLLPSSCARPGLDCPLQVRGTVSRHNFGMTGYRLTLRDDVDLEFRLRLREEATR